MKNVSILVPESSVMQAIADPRYLFSAVNQFLTVSGKQPLFDIRLVGATREVRLNDGLYTVHADKVLADVAETDLVIIPALAGDMAAALSRNQGMLPWIIA
ncbi:MAG TPA: AraC family transcriptional regulator, partial [Sphingobacteriaceae bacterium]